MTYGIRQSNQFKKDLKQCVKRGLNLEEFKTVLVLLQNGASLPERYRDHPLQPSKDFKNCRELHIEPDWLLVYKYSNESVILYLVRTGAALVKKFILKYQKELLEMWETETYRKLPPID